MPKKIDKRRIIYKLNRFLKLVSHVSQLDKPINRLSFDRQSTESRLI